MSTNNPNDLRLPYIELGYIINFYPTPIIILNNEFKIKYLNLKALQLFTKYESTFQEYMPDFKVSNVIDSEFSYLVNFFDKYYNSLKELDFGNLVTMEIPLANVLFVFKVSKAYDQSLRSLGYTIEIHEVTDMNNILNNCNNALDMALNGKFDHLIDTTKIDDGHYFRGILQKINRLFNKLNNFTMDLSCQIDEMSVVDLPEAIKLSRENNKTDNFYKLIKIDLEQAKQYQQNKCASCISENQNINYNLNSLSHTKGELQYIIDEKNKLERSLCENLNNLHYEVIPNNSIYEQNAELQQIGIQSQILVNDVREKMSEISNCVQNLTMSVKTMEHLVSLHMNDLKEGLHMIETGSWGSGVKIIKNQTLQLMRSSSDSSKNILEFAEKISEFKDNTMEKIIILSNILDKQLYALNMSMEFIKNSQNNHHEKINEINNFLKNMTNYTTKVSTVVHQIDSSVQRISELSNELGTSMNQKIHKNQS